MEEIRIIRSQNSSFRDSHGHVFLFNQKIYRSIKLSYKKQYDHFIISGLYDELIKEKLLIEHTDVTDEFSGIVNGAYKIIKPEKIQFISYPTEWCFSQIKDAALITLRVQQIALKYGMVLKDSSAYNLQFFRGRFVFIDTLSFDFFQTGVPWIAYKQFCEHFLGPLYLISHVNPQLMRLFTTEGISLTLSNRLLPISKKMNFSLLLHISLHARAQRMFKEEKVKRKNTKLFTQSYLERLTQSLTNAVMNIRFKQQTQWGDYYEKNVDNIYLLSKREIVTLLLNKISPLSLLDIGANNGEFSRIAASKGIFTISIDSDHASTEENYKQAKQVNEEFLLPLLIDISDPTPSFGWANIERDSFLSRSKPDLILLLAIVHHLVIVSGIPLKKIAELFSNFCKDLIIEYVPKDDHKVRMLLQNREDIFDLYSQEEFEKVFRQYFHFVDNFPMMGSQRIIYHFRAK
ncbi:MAG: SAM-dependent methyltransferase [Bacteroidota bacterium]